jgi:hypothetical protein
LDRGEQRMLFGVGVLSKSFGKSLVGQPDPALVGDGFPASGANAAM